jgi:hypothetical protein
MRSARSRGYVMLIVVVSLAVLAALVAIAIRFTGGNRLAATAQARQDKTASCAEAARRYLLSQLQISNITSLTLDSTLPNAVVTGQRTQFKTAHYGFATEGAHPVSQLGAASVAMNNKNVRDVSNVVIGANLGGQFYRVVVMCHEPGSGDETEVEFVFRYGL